jgi:hypothetical protein
MFAQYLKFKAFYDKNIDEMNVMKVRLEDKIYNMGSSLEEIATDMRTSPERLAAINKKYHLISDNYLKILDRIQNHFMSWESISAEKQLINQFLSMQGAIYQPSNTMTSEEVPEVKEILSSEVIDDSATIVDEGINP